MQWNCGGSNSNPTLYPQSLACHLLRPQWRRAMARIVPFRKLFSISSAERKRNRNRKEATACKYIFYYKTREYRLSALDRWMNSKPCVVKAYSYKFWLRNDIFELTIISYIGNKRLIQLIHFIEESFNKTATTYRLIKATVIKMKLFFLQILKVALLTFDFRIPLPIFAIFKITIKKRNYCCCC